MILEDYFNQRFEDYFTNPVVVLIAFFFIIFAMVFSVFTRLGLFGRDKSVPAIIALAISALAVYGFNDLVYWFGVFNLLLTLAIIFVLMFILKPFLKFLRINF